MTTKGYEVEYAAVAAGARLDAPVSVPRWLESAVFYQVFPERFCNGDPSNDPAYVEPWGGVPTRENFFGGDLQGITQHLDHIQSLGANALYLTPVFTAGTNHRYDGEDYFAIDPVLGGDKAFDELVDAAHRRGMRVVLDGVFNHCGWHHPYFEDVLDKGPKSRYVNWFLVEDFPVVSNPEPNYETCSGCVYLPKWNVYNPEVREHHFRVALHWLERGIDGWRLDVPYFINDVFWKRFRSVVKERFPDACLIGEEWQSPTRWLHGDTFDGTMNYGLRDLALAYAATRKADASATARAALALQDAIPPHAAPAMMNLLGSHDTPRLFQECGDDVAAVCEALALMFAFPGAPMIYYGDEVGMRGDNDPGCRGCMSWDRNDWNHELLAVFKSFTGARRDSMSLGRGRLEIPYAVGDVIALRNNTMNGTTTTLINRNSAATVVPGDLMPPHGRDLMTLVGGRFAKPPTAVGDWLVVPGRSVRLVEEVR